MVCFPDFLINYWHSSLVKYLILSLWLLVWNLAGQYPAVRAVGESAREGLVHWRLAQMHLDGRLECGPRTTSSAACLYYASKAALLGCAEACFPMARLHEGLESDALPGLSLELEDRDESSALTFYQEAAKVGELQAAVRVARAFQLGELGAQLNWLSALQFWDIADTLSGDISDVGLIGQLEQYQIRQTRADLLRAGGHGLQLDLTRAAELYSEASELAMGAFKVRLGTKLMMLAEEVAAEAEIQE